MAKFIGKPPGTPFDLPGTYVTPTGNVSSAGGSAIKKVYGGGGGGSSNQATVNYQEELRKQAERDRIAKELADRETKIRADQLASQNEKNLLIAKARVEASKQRQAVYSTDAQRIEFNRQNINQVVKEAGKYYGKNPSDVTPVNVLSYTTGVNKGEIQRPITEQVQQQGIIYEKQIDTYRPKGVNKDIPVYATFYSINGVERKATKGEESFYRSQPNRSNVLYASTKEVSKPGLATGLFNTVNTNLYQSITEPIDTRITKATGMSPQQLIYKGVDLNLIGFNTVGLKKSNSFKEFEKGFAYGIYSDIRDQPLKQVIIYGSSAGVGALSTGFSAGASAVGSTTGKIVTGISNIGLIGVGGYYTAKTGYEIYSAPTYYEKGKITGLATKDVILFGKGFSAGKTGYLKVQGQFMTYGRTEIPIEKLVPQEVIEGSYNFPRARNIKQELNFFKNEYNPPIEKLSDYGKTSKLVYSNEYSKLPFKVPSTAYHVTPNKFFKETFSASAGTSELPGTYTSYSPSVYFAKIKGESSYSIKNIVKNIFEPSSRPAIAGLQPEGFRFTGFKKVKPYQIEGEGTFFKFSFKKPAKAGYLDLPGMKTGGEAEAVLRLKGGSYGLVGKQYYTVWKGVKIPIDVFKYSKVETKDIKTFSPSSNEYSLKSLKPSYKTTSIQSTKIEPTKKKISYSSIKYKPSSISSSISSKASSYVPSSSISSSNSSSRSYSSSSVSSIVLSSKSSSSKASSGKLSSSLLSYKRSYGSSSNRYTPYSPPNKTTKTLSSTNFRIPYPKTSGKYVVSVRRFGKFKPVGIFSSQQRAFNVGRSITGTTLGATFKVSGSKPTATPSGYYRKKTKEGVLFIEQPKYRLSTGTEKLEIQSFKRTKRRSKRK